MSIGSEEFEAWARSKSLDLAYRNFPDVGKYYECPRTLLALEAWQDSREYLVIKLPSPSDFAASDDAYFILNQCQEAIEEACLKVKP